LKGERARGAIPGWSIPSAVLILVASLSPAPARADEDRRGRAGASLVFTTTPSSDSISTRHVSPAISAEYSVTPRVAISLDWGLSYTRYAAALGGANSRLGPGNLLLGGHYAFLKDRGVLLRGGIGLSAPLAFRAGNLSERTAADFNYTTAGQARGLMQPWAWTLNTISVLTLWSAELKLPSGPVFGGDAALAVMFPISEPIDKTMAAFTAAAEAGYAIGPATPGVRLQLSSRSRAVARDDFTQLSIEPFVKGDFGRSYARLGFLLNLDGPAGVFGDNEGAMYGLNAGGGVTF
jgi:hypothetical protein